MSSLFGDAFQSDSSSIEAVVTFVDPIRYVATVKTLRGQYLNDVAWLGEDYYTPKINSRVFVSTGLGYPIILGKMPSVGSNLNAAISSTGTTTGIDTGNASTIRNGYTLNPDKPTDFLPGDKVITSQGGGLLALLRSGGVVLRASLLSQLFFSKFDGLARLVGRNLQLFSDSSSTVSANIRGKLFHWFGVDWDLTRTTTNSERYNEAYGQVPTAEVMRGQPSAQTGVIDYDGRVRKIWLNDNTGNSVMVETLYDSGKLTVVVNNIGSTTVTQDHQEWQTTTTDETLVSTITVVPGSILVNHNDKAQALFDETHINLNYNSKTINFSDTGVDVDALGHYVHVRSDGVHMG